MSAAGVAQTLASQREYIKEDLALLYAMSGTLWKMLQARTDVKAISNRPARIPFEVLAGGKFHSDPSNFNGGDLGRGSGPTEVPGYLSCVSFVQASEYTALAEYSTDSDEKAIQNFVTLTNQRATQTMGGYMDAVVQGNGSNTLDTVVSTTTNGLVVNNANLFQDNQDVDCYSSLGGSAAFLGTVTIQSVDILQNTIWLTSAVPGSVTTGTLLLVSGSAGIANSGLAGLRSYQNVGNTGTYMGIQRSAYQGKYSTPNISLNSTITPASARALNAQIELSLGTDKADESDLQVHCNVDMRASWENVAINVQSIANYGTGGGNTSADMLKAKPTMTVAGRPMLINIRAVPGIMDFLALKYWWRLETAPLDYYEVAGQTVFPTYGASGGLETNLIFYLRTMCQVGNSQPRAGAYLSNVTIPKYYFGH